ncbi:unnamed protein product [Knipowitschia caucasica]
MAEGSDFSRNGEILIDWDSGKENVTHKFHNNLASTNSPVVWKGSAAFGSRKGRNPDLESVFPLATFEIKEDFWLHTWRIRPAHGDQTNQLKQQVW